MANQRFEITIIFDTNQKEISGEVLEDLSAIMSQYGFKVEVVSLTSSDKGKPLGVDVPGYYKTLPTPPEAMDISSGKQPPAKVLKFPIDRLKHKKEK